MFGARCFTWFRDVQAELIFYIHEYNILPTRPINTYQILKNKMNREWSLVNFSKLNCWQFNFKVLLYLWGFGVQMKFVYKAKKMDLINWHICSWSHNLISCLCESAWIALNVWDIFNILLNCILYTATIFIFFNFP